MNETITSSQATRAIATVEILAP
ncbi:unnamed protein product, partial [Rotaria magnacalcarata]